MPQLRTYYTYIIQCSDGSFYTGKTVDLEKRVKQHNGVLKGGAKYTRVRRPVRLVYSLELASNQEACKKEAELKLLSHEQKRVLCLEETKS